MKLKKIIIIVLTIVIISEIIAQIRDSLKNDVKSSKKEYDAVIFTRNGNRITSRKTTLKYVLAPFTIYKNYPNQKTEFCSINSLGFRGKEINRLKSDKKLVVIIGGSGAFGWGTDTDAHTIPACLDELNNDYEVINAGVPGFLSGQELTYLVTELIDLNPDIIIAYDGWNDIWAQWYSYNRKKGDFGHVGLEFIEAQLIQKYETSKSVSKSALVFLGALFNFSLLQNSALCRRISRVIYRIKKRQIMNYINKPGKKNNVYFEQIIKNYTNNIIKMKQICDMNKIKFIPVIQADLGFKNIVTNYEKKSLAIGMGIGNRYKTEFNQIFQNFIYKSRKKLKINNIFLQNINDDVVFNNNNNTLFYDCVHTNKEGNKIIANIINFYIINY